jgi:hypothetical protein
MLKRIRVKHLTRFLKPAPGIDSMPPKSRKAL